MSSRPLIDVIPIMKREQDGTDHAVRLPELRGAGPGQDGLPGPATDDLTVVATRDRRGIDIDGRAVPPARRRRHLRAAARGDTLGVFQFDGSGYRAAAPPDAPRQVRRHHRARRALPSGPDGHQHPRQLRVAQERSAAESPTSPRRRPGAWSGCWGRPTACSSTRSRSCRSRRSSAS